jgi:hypothetical protein
MIHVLRVGHSFPTEYKGIMANRGKGIEIENSRLFAHHLETVKDS